MYLPVAAVSPPETMSDPGTSVSPVGTGVMAWYAPALSTVKPELEEGMRAMGGAVIVVIVEPVAALVGADTPAPLSSTTETVAMEALSCSPM